MGVKNDTVSESNRDFDESRFDWVTFDEGEEVVWEGEPHKSSIIPGIIIGVLLIPFLGLGLVIIGIAYTHLKNTDYVVTNRGVYKKKGVLSRQVTSIGFEKIQNISFKQGIFGNYFGYGTVEISTAGGEGAEMSFKSVGQPKEVQELINKRIERKKKEEVVDACPECGHKIDDGWLACPECGEKVREVCSSCESLVETGWSFCPYCSSKI